MKKIVIIWMITFISVLIPIIWYTFDIFILDHCDAKFGCIGGFQLIIYLHVILAIIMASIFSSSYYYIYKKYTLSLSKSIYIGTALLGFILSLLSPYYVRNFTNEIVVMILGWFIISLISSMLFYEIQRYLIKSQSTPL